MFDPIDLLRDILSWYNRLPEPELVLIPNALELRAHLREAKKTIDEYDRCKCLDGQTRVLQEQDIEPGVVVRTPFSDGFLFPFNDTVILGTEEKSGLKWVKLARPYLYASSTETMCPSALTGVERYEITIDMILRGSFHVVLDSTGKAVKRIT